MWYFANIGKGQPIQELHIDEFFTNTSLASSVVRESVQNSIDAKSNNFKTVKIVYTIGRTITTGDIFKGLEDHLIKSDIKISNLDNQNFTYLIIEDYSTTGLTGSIIKSSEESSNFSNFWWYDGNLKKAGKNGGRWGLGKYTFFECSYIKSFWAITRREDDNKTFLMGRSILKPHKIGDNEYIASGYFVNSSEFDPIQDNTTITDFQKIFNSDRVENGLSIFIPFIKDDITIDSIRDAIYTNALFPILTGNIEIELNDNIVNKHFRFTKEFLNKNIEQLSFFKDFLNENNIIQLKMYDYNDPDVNENSFDDLNKLKEKYTNKKLIKFRVPIVIEEQDKTFNTYFTIGIQKSDDNLVYCFRSGVNIIKGLNKIDGNNIILSAEDEKIAEFLGDAEEPSHTEWKLITLNSKNKYKNGKLLLNFIKSCASKIIQILNSTANKRYKNFLIDFFYIDKSDATHGSPANTIQLPDNIESSPSELNIINTNDGFEIKPNTRVYQLKFDLKVAYVNKEKNAFNQYDKYDFIFDICSNNDKYSPIIKTNIINGIIEKNIDYNELKILVYNKDFCFTAYGFDINRDIVIKTKVLKNDKENQISE